MPMQFEIIEGVLLAMASETPKADQTATQDSLLLAWLAGNKANDPDKMTQVLGQIGWTVTDAANTKFSAAVSQVGPKIEAALDDGNMPIPDFAKVLAAKDGPGHALASSWWKNDGLGRILAVARSDTALVIQLVRASVTIRDAWNLFFSTEAQADVQLSSSTLTLNAQIWAKIQTDVATKVAPYRKDIQQL